MLLPFLEQRSRASDAEDYFDKPFDSYYLGRRFFAAAFRPDIFTLVAWGRIDVPDFKELELILRAKNLQRHKNRRQFVCHQSVESISVASMTQCLNLMKAYPAYQAGIKSEALCRGPGIVGMMTEGFYRIGGMPFPAKTFVSKQEALDWLAPEVPTAPIIQGLDTWRSKLGPNTDPFLGQLKAILFESQFRIGLPEVARQLGISSRSLQRRVQNVGTRFDGELNTLRMSVAEERLSESNLDIQELAAELNYATASAFISAFKRFHGLTPLEYRASVTAQ